MSLGETQQTETDESDRDAIMEVQNARVQFDMSRGQAWVLNDVDMDVYRGEILAVVGESGSGKSMFASALLDAVEDPGVLTGEVTYYPEPADSSSNEVRTLDDADDGEVDLLGLSRRGLDRIRWEDIAMVFQGALNSFNPTMKIRHHFHETIRAHDHDMDERMDHVRDLFDALHLDFHHVMGAYPHELSGGMKQRTLIALALVLDPKVLVMDEPTAALDLLMQRSIISMLRNLQEEFDLTIVFITHDLSLVAGLSDRIAVMYAFEFIEAGETDVLLKDAAHPYTRALLRSMPSIDSDVNSMQPIDGVRPDPVNIPTGCSFHPRCPVSDDRCEIEDPDLVGVDDDNDHQAACFYTDKSRMEIDYDLHGERWEGSR